MGLLDWLTGRKRRADLELMIRGLAEAARHESALQGMESAQAALWTIFCDGAEDIVWQLVVKNSDQRLDWGLKRRRRRIDRVRLLTIFWWMILYHLVLWKHRGVDAGPEQNDVQALETVAREFLERHSQELSPPVETLRPWDDRWNRQFTLESAMSIYNAVYGILGLPNDTTRRIDHVSDFTTVTERNFDERIKILLDQ